jgi:signal peptidase II
MHIAVQLTLIALVLVFFLYLIRPYLNLRAGRLAAVLVLGGAVGNLIDRIFRVNDSGRHFVVDYLDFHVWPVFNLADTCVVIGVALLVLLVLRSERTRSDEPESDPEGISA